MEHIYAPWRYNYVTDEKVKGCVFCHISENLEDEKLQVIFSDEYCAVLTNRQCAVFFLQIRHRQSEYLGVYRVYRDVV